MRSLLLSLAAILIAFVAFAATELRNGVWTAELDADTLNLTIFQGRHRGSILSLTIQPSKLRGLTRDAITGSGADVKFALVRAAGVFAFDGHFAGGKGAGHFHFTPDPTFLHDMEDLGYSGFRDEELLFFAAEDFEPANLRELKAMGYEVKQKDLEELAVFHITPAVVREYASHGNPNLKLRDLVELRALVSAQRH